MKFRRFLAVLPLVVLLCSRAHADLTITVDEFGNGIGTDGSASRMDDTGPGGGKGVLAYPLPFAGVPGDVLLNDGTDILPLFGDVLRFNGDGTLLFYSDNVDEADAPADTPGPPADVATNFVTISESGDEGNNGAVYTPGSGDPGYDGEFTPTYHFISDGVVPEPGSLALLATGGLPLLGVLRRRKRA